ncbi:MAG: hypothetical protein HY420_00770 [Candidatus Kerfeldbacteria bacterium]|nr:hypothetical protein [Candidatus Kerfeldbacteria bacterium]
MRFIMRHGRLMRSSNRFGGDRRKETLDSSCFPRVVNFLRLNGRVLARELVEEAVLDLELLLSTDDLADLVIEFCHSRRFTVDLTPERRLLVNHQPSANGAVMPVSPNGRRREPIIGRWQYRCGPATPSWL